MSLYFLGRSPCPALLGHLPPLERFSSKLQRLPHRLSLSAVWSTKGSAERRLRPSSSGAVRGRMRALCPTKTSIGALLSERTRGAGCLRPCPRGVATELSLVRAGSGEAEGQQVENCSCKGNRVWQAVSVHKTLLLELRLF